jgi:hypothetical protein
MQREQESVVGQRGRADAIVMAQKMGKKFILLVQ